MTLNNFNLTDETAFLFVLSHEYGLPFAVLLSLYDLSDSLFWGYISVLTPALKMGVRKGSQLSKTAQRIYKSMHGLKERKQEKVEKLAEDAEGNVVLDKNGNPKKEKITINRYEDIILSEDEEGIKNVLQYYVTQGYSNGEKFYTESEIFDMKTSRALKKDILTIDGENYLKCSKLEHFIEKYMPELELADFRKLSVKDLRTRIEEMTNVEAATVEA